MTLPSFIYIKYVLVECSLVHYVCKSVNKGVSDATLCDRAVEVVRVVNKA